MDRTYFIYEGRPYKTLKIKPEHGSIIGQSLFPISGSPSFISALILSCRFVDDKEVRAFRWHGQ